MDKKWIINRINNLRENKGWTQQQLADASQVDYDTIYAILHEGRMPDIATMEKLCCALGVSLSCFFADDEVILHVTKEQKGFLELYGKLCDNDKEKAKDFMDDLLGEKKNRR